ncbi:hypothetical protein J2W23_005257 [Variovorax boronicumulans]|uniref:hypothetical protein n=1 Tax=Variovorax boronicumulans TaxID=436515 RepID=UPI0027871DF3|nr:hypothetical protein [Variovorax boronicumulans]MDQ0016849.1 hypothetical protein [Variovorax boronicumulans]
MAKVRPDFLNIDDVTLTRLHLDPENPRHDPIQDEDRIIAQLFGAEKTLAVAKDIAQKGAISPLDRIGVIEMEDNPGHYIVVEGNRRTCALKVLHDPKKAPNTTIRDAIEALRASAKVPSKVPVVVFKDRVTAEPWLKLRHLGAQGGAGTREWDSAAKNRFARGATPDRLAVALLDRAEEAGWIDPVSRKTISVTTMTRYVSNPVVRAALGLGSSSELKFTHEPAEVDAALQSFVNDALSQNGAEPVLSSRSRKADRVAYANALHQRGVAPRTSLPAPIDAPAPQEPTAAKKGRNPRSPDKRPHIVQSSFVAKHGDKNLQRILQELRTIKPDDGYVFSTNYLVRATVERIMVLYAIKHGFHQSGTPDHLLVKQCHEHLGNNGATANQLKVMRVAASNKDVLYSLDTLGSAVHGAHLPTRAGLIAVWDNWEPSLRLMLDRM